MHYRLTEHWLQIIMYDFAQQLDNTDVSNIRSELLSTVNHTQTFGGFCIKSVQTPPKHSLFNIWFF